MTFLGKAWICSLEAKEEEKEEEEDAGVSTKPIAATGRTSVRIPRTLAIKRATFKARNRRRR